MRLKLGMVGGGNGAFIGGVHRIAARLDGDWDLVAGAFSSDLERAAQSAAELGIAAQRSFDSFAAMAKAEAPRPDGIDAVAIVTPNHLHAPVATAFLRAGIPVICDKPLATTVEDAEALVKLVAETGLPFILTQTLHRLSDGPRGTGPDRGWSDRSRPSCSGGVSTGLTGHAGREFG